MANLSYAEISKILKCDVENGKLYWLPRSQEMFADARNPDRAKIWNARYAGRLAFETVCNGYRHGSIFSRRYFAHRIVWLFATGNWPVNQIDHINGNRSDNRISNLRDVTKAENMKNMRVRSKSKSGSNGVYWYEAVQKWQVYISVNGKTKNLGSFADKNAAVAARKDAEAIYGYHANHGRFHLEEASEQASSTGSIAESCEEGVAPRL